MQSPSEIDVNTLPTVCNVQKQKNRYFFLIHRHTTVPVQIATQM